MTPDPKLKIGVIGLGKMGIMHACLLNTFPNVQVAGVCDKSRLIRTMAKQPFKDALVTDDIEDFTDLNLDAVFVLTPIPSHYPIIKQIYDKKIANNVFVEKTLTAKHSQSEELQTIAQQMDSVNMVGYMKRFAVTFNQAKNFLDQHVLGNVESFDAYAFSSDFDAIPDGSTASIARGGVLEDLGSHMIDLAVWFFGDLKPTSAIVNSRIAAESEDDVSFAVDGAEGLQGKFDVSWRKAEYRMPEFSMTVTGKKGSLRVNDDEIELHLNDAPVRHWYRPDLEDNVEFLLGGPEYYREDKHYLDVVRNVAAPKSDFKEALRVDFLIEQVRQLCRTN
jgi:predicted dehydrogenase